MPAGQVTTPAGIRFPVLRAFEISGYLLFPGTDGQGIARRLEKGISIIAGINGIGKTTLLNALLRLLIGPWDVLREDPDDIGSTRHELVRWRSPNYFAGRVPDRAASATIGGWISFGTERVYVLRSLKDLSIEELAHNGVPLEPSDETYQELVKNLTGVDTYYDFHFLVRNLLFYLEDRRPLIWADEGQFEISRILFVPGPDATRTSRLYDDIKQLDSRYRNLLTEHNRNLRRLSTRRIQAGAADDARAAAAAAQEAYAGSVEALARLDAAADELITEEREVAAEMRRQQLELEGLFRAYEGLQQSYFANAFPQSEESFRYILAHMVSDGGCLVCGSGAEAKADELRRR
ncbi:hypothetical protein D8770_27355, partial [Methylobacterium sp. DB1607]|nr:hypothetical protein [Methylobacterium sp. DB1607]